MKKYLIATHSNMAKGMYDTINFILGKQNNLNYYCAYSAQNEIPDEDINEFLELHKNEQLVIFSDILSGSVTQKFYKYIENPNIFLVTGVNIPIIMSLMLNEEKVISQELINQLIEEAKEQLVQVKYKSSENQDNDE